VPTISPAAWDDPEVARLTAAQQAELRDRYGWADEPGRPPSAAGIAVVLVARDDDGTPIGCGALRPLDDGEAELKRMYVVPAARGRGVSKLLLAGLEVEALSRGWTTLRLATGLRQPEAMGLYMRAGYEPAAAFGAHGDEQDALFLARGLT
jgi:GNAT superfamily N-acetyltransferase